jgi:amino acid adenylation domain-containing protein/non-ribosomal peptide synthase protein (TIGR01720 family)
MTKKVADLYKLSPIQHGMLFHSLYSPDSGVYFEQVGGYLRDAIDETLFRQAWQQVINHHPILRTAFFWEELDEPLQVVQRQARLPFEQHDWRDLASDEQSSRLQTYLDEDRRRGFDLSQAPLMRIALIRLDQTTYYFVWSYHHLLLDGWSTQLVQRDVASAYAALLQGQPVTLPQSRPFKDYIVWLRQQDMQRAATFWQQTLRGFTAATPLDSAGAAARPYQAQPVYNELRRSCALDLTRDLQAFARQQRLTINTLIQAAWALQLSHISGERDIVFGVTVSGRPHILSGSESMVGVFINTLPLRVQVEPTMPLLRWLEELRTRQGELLQYEYTPLTEIQSWSDAPRGEPLFESIVVFENFPSSLGSRSKDGHIVQRTNYPLALVVELLPELHLRLIYDQRRFEDDAMQRRLAALEVIFQSLIGSIDRPLRDVPRFPAAERAQVLAWNTRTTPFPVGACVHALFAAQAARTPDAPALTCDGVTLSYAALDQRANQLAHQLRALGVGPDTVVGVCLDRSHALVVALLAVLKADGAYLPLDPHYPPERRRFLLQDARALALISHGQLAADLDDLALPILDLDRDGAAIARQPATAPPSAATPAQLAYVIYTSGSTGQPKGVAVPHANVVRLFAATQDWFAFGPQDVWTLFHSAAFDFSVWELWGALLHGGRLVVVPYLVSRSPDAFVDLVRREGVTVLNQTPSAFRQFIQAEATGAGAPLALRSVIFGGEALELHTLGPWVARHGDQRPQLVNMYGITETTVHVTYRPLRAADLAHGRSVIGAAIPDLELYVLDAALEPTPIGVAGELYVGGAGLARGYLNRPGLTAARFRPHPWSAEPGARLYQTGDLARYLPDGELEYLGRIDQQVKLRGFRIELGEIEAALAQHRAVREAVVLAREDQPDETRLVAYVVPATGEQGSGIKDELADPVALRQVLAQTLPEYMIPAAFVLLDALPLTPNGKLDRKALPAPAQTRPDLDSALAAPRTPVEERLVAIWADVLHIEQLGITDNFFALGGHSLLATQLLSRVHEAFQVTLPIQSLFETPTVAGQARWIEAARRASVTDQMPPIEPVVRDAERPLAFPQQRLWFLDQLQPNSPAYNISFAVRLVGQLDQPALEASIDEIVRRHEALRTIFPARNGRPTQEIAPAEHVPLELIDLSEQPQAAREPQLHLLLKAEALRPFNLARGPLMRLLLVRKAATEHVLSLTVHHIVFDGWSTGLLMRELSVLYTTLCQDATADRAGLLAPLPVQYADFAVWQRQALHGPALEAQMAYWKRQLADMPVLELPTDRPRPLAPTYRGTTLEFQIPPAMRDALQALNRREGSTMFMTLLAAFQTLLYRYTGQQDVGVGTPIAGRSKRETEALIGCFINTQVLRTDLSNNPTFRELLQRVRQVALEAYDNQDLPFELLVEELHPTRDLNRTPLFHVLFSFQNVPLQPLSLPGLTLESLVFASQTAKFDLSLGLQELENGLLGEWEYSTDLFEASTIARLSDHFHMLLQGIVANPDQRIDDLPLLTAAERRQLLTDWNSARLDYPADQCIHMLFEAQAARTPDAIAAVFAEVGQAPQQLSYDQLNRRANQLAHHLRALGVGPEARVGICLERSLEMLVGLLGIVKAGAAYVPLDPAYPQERLQFMFADAQMPVLVTQRHLRAALPEHAGPIVYLDDDRALLDQQPQHNPINRSDPRNVVYVIYTSGSTGRPKGVLIDHHALVDHSHAVVQRCAMQPSDRLLQFASLNSDIAVEDLFPTWLSGATVVLWPDPNAAAFDEFLAFADRERISVWNLPTAYWHSLTAELARTGRPGPRALRLVIVGGEQALPERLATWRRLVSPAVRWNNAYGPTEATISTTIYEPPADPDAEPLRTIPIGRPMANTQIYLLDQHLQPAPIGQPGELHIGGARLARGYLNCPDLTAERFIPDPFGAEPGARLYRTGDLARYLPDGNIEFLGRIDQQVKVRGFRIELSEIESVLLQHPAVEDVAVLAREDMPGDRRLVAYVVARESRGENHEPSDGADGSQFLVLGSDLRSFVKARLPEYMLPIFVLMEALPLTPNGKVDRRALPAPAADRALQADAFVAPRTDVEARLAQIWAELLRLDRVGIHDNFFALGGDSILSIQIIARANQAGLSLAPRDLFQYQTIAELAPVVRSATTISATQELVVGPAPLTPIQRWFFEQQLPDPHHYNQALLIDLRQPPLPALLEEALSQVVAHHDALRMRFRLTASGWQALNAGLELRPALTQIDLSDLPASEQPARLERAIAELQASLDLTNGPLVRAALIKPGATPAARWRLALIMHHLVVDGVSWRILLEDLQTAYEQLSRAQAAALPRKTTAFKQWAEYLQGYAQSAALMQEQRYWLAAQQPAGAPLPRDWPSEANTVASAATIAVALDAAATEALLRDVPRVYRTQINDVLLAALAQTIAAWTGDPIVRLDLEGHGREDLFADVDLSRTVGWFTTLFPVRLDIAAADGPGALLKTVKEQLRAIPQHGIGYGLLRYLRDADQTTAEPHAPPAEISFNYLGQAYQALPPTGLFDTAREASGPAQSPRGRRSHLLETAAIVAGDQLRVTWTYSSAVHRPETIQSLAQSFLSALQALIAHCLSPEAGGYTPSDFPLARLDQAQLDQLLAEQPTAEDLYGLTPLQQGMLFHTLHEPQLGMYIEQLSLPLYGDLDVAAFQAAWQQVVDRHPALRTVFVWDGLAEPVQAALRQAELPWRLEDWRADEPATQQRRLQDWLAEDRRRGFALSEAPLMRMALFQTGPERFEFVWSSHHLLMDGWSLPIVLNEVFALYAGRTHGQPRQLPPPQPFRSYLAWLQRQDLQQAEQFWRRTLAGFHTPTPLVVDRAQRPETATHGSAQQRIQLDPATTATLVAMARQAGLTLNTLIQGAWALLLSIYSGADDVVFGATVSGRPPELAGVEQIIGLLINTLPVRVLVEPGAPLTMWLHALQTRLAEMRQFEYSPLVQIQQWSEVAPGQPLFESIVVFENYPVDPSAAAEGAQIPLQIGAPRMVERTNYPLTLISALEGALSLRLLYDEDRFDPAAIERMLGHLHTLLAAFATQPEQPVGWLSPLSAVERQLLSAWNATATAAPLDRCVHHLAADQAERTPDVPAVIYADYTPGAPPRLEQLSYDQLNRRANRLAHHLRALGVGPDTPVAVCLPRSCDLAVAVLGVLKAGGAYLPLDPAYPAERLSLMLHDAHAPLVVTRVQLAAQLPIADDRLVCLDQIELSAADDAPDVAVTPDNLAYVIYTSGSTGRPKGVAMPHRPLVNLLAWQRQETPLAVGARTLQFAPLSFDVSFQELFATWSAGGTLVMLSEEARRDMPALLRLLREMRIERLFLPFVALQQLAGAVAEGLAPPAQLREIITAGEQLQITSPIASLLGSLPGCRLHNQYGPSESHVVTAHTLGDDPDAWPLLPPIGRPIANARMQLLDRQLRPAPVGVPGELHIGGVALARGYLDQPALTAERFIPDPWSDQPGARLYRTGDLARYLPDGQIEFLGRIDQQVKVRGFRIEPGEVEHALLQHPAVREAIVMARQITPGDTRLVAYLTPAATDDATLLSLSAQELQRFLGARLPDYMTPSSFVMLERMPLTPSGKLNRAALLDNDQTRPQIDAPFVAPRTPVEETLAGIWSQILGVERIGVHDNFFALGGHSLLATQVQSRIRAEYQADLPLRELFAAPTIAELAETIIQRTVAQADSETLAQLLAALED